MQKNPQRPLNSSLRDKIGRDGRVPKRLDLAPTVIGQKRQTSGALHPHLHGQVQDDAVPEKSFTRAAPIHSATPSRTDRGQHVEGLGSTILNEAANLGRKPEKA